MACAIEWLKLKEQRSEKYKKSHTNEDVA